MGEHSAWHVLHTQVMLLTATTYSFMQGPIYHHDCSEASIAIITFLLMEPQEGCLICGILRVLVSLEINLPSLTRNTKGNYICIFSCLPSFTQQNVFEINLT